MNVSVIIPVYNVALYITECLKSVMSQTYQGCMECLLIDDCGTDESIVIAEKYISVYEGPIRFEIIRHECNRGLSAARNTGTKVAKGKYVYYLDGDDVIATDCIEKLMAQVVLHPDVDLVQGNVEILGANNTSYIKKSISQTYALNNDEVRRCFFNLKQMPINAWNKMIRRDVIIRKGLSFREDLLFEDNLWSFYLNKILGSACFVEDVTYCHRRRSCSIVTGTEKAVAATHYLAIYREIIINLSPGYEKQELLFYVNWFITVFLKYNRFMPEYKDVFRLYWDKTKDLGAWCACFKLAISRVLGLSKYGWMTIPIRKKILLLF